MAPTATSARPDLLEHPTEVFAAFRRDGIAQVICEEKHMGSRAVVVVCRDPDVAARRFKIDDPIGGTIYTRTGRAFFADPAWQAKVIEHTREAVGAANLWDDLDTDWVALDAELLPWSAKAEDLLRTQYAAVGAAGHAMTSRASELLATALHRGVDVTDVAHRTEQRVLALDQFIDAYRRYCWSVEEPDDLQLAPFVVLAAEGALLAGRDHLWHMSIADRLAAASDKFIRPTRNLTVDLADPDSEAAAVTWWEQLVAGGGEGMVVKPVDAIVTGKRGLIQPGIKCRGPEYLRIIYGPEYLAPPQPRTASRPRARQEAIPRTTRVRPRHRSPRTLRRRRTPPSRPRMRLRRPRNGERARRSPALSGPGYGRAARRFGTAGLAW